MDPAIAVLIDQDTPKLNPLTANGLAVTHMQEVEKYIDQVFRSVAQDFPPGFEYIKCERCTPLEEYKEQSRLTKKNTAKCRFDVARSDVYMMKYYFRFNGVDLHPRYLMLPFVSDAGVIMLGGSRFVISPILADQTIQVGSTNIFVKLLKAKLTFERMNYHYRSDGIQETVQVPWSTIHNKNKTKGGPKPLIKANCTLVHYLFCKYGFTETFVRFANARPVVGTSSDITEENYPKEDWVICQSRQIKPKGIWVTTSVKIAVRRSEYTSKVKSMIGGFFYVADHFPNSVLTEYVDKTRMWMIVMGQIIFSGNMHQGQLYDDIATHMGSLDEYIDSLTHQKLREIGVPVDNVYDLFSVIIENFNAWLLAANDKVNSMYDKELSILYYVLYEITHAIVLMYFKLKSASKKELTKNEVESILHRQLKPGLIFKINKMHGEVSTISAPGDNKAFKITSLLVPQASSNRQTNRNDRSIINDLSKRLHVSVAEIGSYTNLPKSAPDGRSRLNHVAMISPKSVVMRNPKWIELLDSVQALLRN